MARLGRGAFLAAGLVGVAGSVPAGPPPAHDPMGSGATAVRRVVVAMGSPCALEVSAPSRREGLARLEMAISAIEQVEARLSSWREDSELSRLNGATPGRRVAISGELAADLARARELSDATGGAFDPAIGRLVAAWDLRGAGRIPTAEALRVARRGSGLDLLDIDLAARTVRRRLPGATLDAGAFGKGVGIAAAARALEEGGATRWSLDLGGQIALHGGGHPPVAVADPRARGRAAAWLDIEDVSAATSSNSERAKSVGHRSVGHILDPRTGTPAGFTGSVSVVSVDPVEADALSTALFVMGPDDGMAWATRQGRVQALFLIKEAHGLCAIWTPGLDGRVELADGVNGRCPDVVADEPDDR
ncbi:MAG: FAD:protein FMN transferase [Acidobacteriota bacterium]